MVYLHFVWYKWLNVKRKTNVIEFSKSFLKKNKQKNWFFYSAALSLQNSQHFCSYLSWNKFLEPKTHQINVFYGVDHKNGSKKRHNDTLRNTTIVETQKKRCFLQIALIRQISMSQISYIFLVQWVILSKKYLLTLCMI